MASLSEVQAALQDRFQDPKYWVLLVLFVVGFLSMLGSIETDIPILGPVFEWIDETLVANVGGFLRLFIGVFLAIFVFQFLIALVTGETAYLNFWGIMASLIVIGIIIVLIVSAPSLFGSGDAGNVFSIAPLDNFMAGGP